MKESYFLVRKGKGEYGSGKTQITKDDIFINEKETGEDLDWLKPDGTAPENINDDLYTEGRISVGQVNPTTGEMSDAAISSNGDIATTGDVKTLGGKLVIKKRPDLRGIEIKSNSDLEGYIRFEANSNYFARPGFNFFQEHNHGWRFWNYLNEKIIEFLSAKVEIFKTLRLSNVTSGNVDSDEMLSIDSSGDVKKVPINSLNNYAFKQNGSGYYEIKVPYTNKVVSMTIIIIRHGQGVVKFTITGETNTSSGWANYFVTKKTQQNSSALEEEVSFTDNSGADFRIYLGDTDSGGRLRNTTALFITEVFVFESMGNIFREHSLSGFPVSIQSARTGTVRGVI